MRSGVVVLISAAALFVLPAAAGARHPQHLVPTAVAFRDALHGEIGLSWDCYCREGGAIAVTSDGGKTWRITRRTTKRILGIGFFHRRYYVEFNGGVLPSGQRFSFLSHCSNAWAFAGYSADIVDPGTERPWTVCTSLGGGGFEAKAVYRGRTRVACTNLPATHFSCDGRSFGGIGPYGYPAGIAGAAGGLGIIWPGGRGVVYVTRDGGHHWQASGVLISDAEEGLWATTVGRTGFLLIWAGGTVRLVETTDAGRSWHVVHRWP